jgi:uncharacterized protein YutD
MEDKEFKNKIKLVESKNKELEQEFISIGFAFITLEKIKKENIILPQIRIKELVLFLKQKIGNLKEAKGVLELEKSVGLGTKRGLEKINNLEEKINEYQNFLDLILRYIKNKNINDFYTLEEFEDFLKKREIYLVNILSPDIIDKIKE